MGCVMCACLLLGGIASAAEVKHLRTDSRTPYVHRLTLYDENGIAISPQDPHPRPYSPAATCGKCHDYQTVSQGWHFNSAHPTTRPGRVGEPWIYIEPTTRTQIPLSYRPLPNAWTPADLGLGDWDFVQIFGRHLPGGLMCDKPADADKPGSRWPVSGRLQIDCMICHAADNTYDPGERARQIEQHNYRWAPTAAMGLASIRGAAKSLPADFDPSAPADPDAPPPGPRTLYDKSKFDVDERVLLDITRRPAADRCYFCHTVNIVGPAAPPRWHVDGDVHLSAGLSCTDCHCNGLDHAIVRGYEGELSPVTTLTCRGCHYGDGAADLPARFGGRRRAPRPQHKGLPTLHLDSISCTACHSGPWPQSQTQPTQTALAHGLGVGSRQRDDRTPPQIVSPVFLRDASGLISPHRAVAPSFWGRLDNGRIRPIPMSQLLSALKAILPTARPAQLESMTALSDEQVLSALDALGEHAVYVNAGKAHRVAEGKLVAFDAPEAAMYAWPLAHDVRPAAQSLGSGGCSDCHSADSPLFFGKVALGGPGATGTPVLRVMHELRGEGPAIWKAWAMAFRGKTLLLVVCGMAIAALAVVLVVYGLRGAGDLLRRMGNP